MSASVRQRRTELHLLREAVILSVRADLEPRDLLIPRKPDGTVSEGRADRVNGVAPRSVASRETSQLVGVEFRRSAG
jgi:hypothetical protein